MSFFRQFNMNDIQQSILDQIEKCLKNKTIHLELRTLKNDSTQLSSIEIAALFHSPNR